MQHAQQVARQAVGLRPVQRIELRLRVGQQGQRLLGLVEAGHARLVGEHGQRQGQRGAAQRHRAPLLGLEPRQRLVGQAQRTPQRDHTVGRQARSALGLGLDLQRAQIGLHEARIGLFGGPGTLGQRDRARRVAAGVGQLFQRHAGVVALQLGQPGIGAGQVGLPLRVIAHLHGQPVEVDDQVLQQVFLHRQATGQKRHRIAVAQRHVVGDVADLRQPGLRLVARGGSFLALPQRCAQPQPQAHHPQRHRRTGHTMPGHELGQQVARVGRPGADRETGQVRAHVGDQRVHAGVALLDALVQRLQQDVVEVTFQPLAGVQPLRIHARLG